MKNGEFENLKHYSNIVYPILFIKKKIYKYKLFLVPSGLQVKIKNIMKKATKMCEKSKSILPFNFHSIGPFFRVIIYKQFDGSRS